jgi:hypothetical protein
MGSSFPSTGGICGASSSIMYNADPLVTTFSIYYSNTKTQVQALISQGPTAAAIYASSGFQAYKNGIYTGCPANSSSFINHAIVLVGYNTTGNYYIIKNSWGTMWGQNGFGYVSMTNDCGISEFVYQFTSSASMG